MAESNEMGQTSRRELISSNKVITTQVLIVKARTTVGTAGTQDNRTTPVMRYNTDSVSLLLGQTPSRCFNHRSVTTK
jgi:hypothetical protein